MRYRQPSLHNWRESPAARFHRLIKFAAVALFLFAAGGIWPQAALPRHPRALRLSGKIQNSRVERALRKGRTVDLDHAIVIGALEIHGPTQLVSEHSKFAGKVTIYPNANQDLEFDSATMLGRFTVLAGDKKAACPTNACQLSISSNNIRFAKPVVLDLRHKKGRFNVSAATFNQEVRILGAGNEVLCSRCSFEASVTLDNSRLNRLRIDHSSFDDFASFAYAKIEFLTILDTTFAQPVDFTRPTIGYFRVPCVEGSPISIPWKEFGPRWVRNEIANAQRRQASGTRGALRRTADHIKDDLLCWKRNYSALGDDGEALLAGHKAWKIQQQYLTAFWSRRRFLGWLGNLPNSYGTDPLRPVITSLATVIAFGFLFLWRDPFVEVDTGKGKRRHPKPLFAMAYSLETFIPIFSTGIKDWGWTIDTSSTRRWAAVFESALGALLTVISAYSLGAHLY